MQIRSLRVISLEVIALVLTQSSSLRDRQTDKRNDRSQKDRPALHFSCTHCWRKHVILTLVTNSTTAPRSTRGSGTPSRMWQILKLTQACMNYKIGTDWRHERFFYNSLLEPSTAGFLVLNTPIKFLQIKGPKRCGVIVKLVSLQT